MEPIRFSFVHNRKNKLNKRGEALIQLCAYQPRSKNKTKHKYFSTGIYISPKQWDTRRAFVVRHDLASRFNLKLSRFKAEFEEKAIEIYKILGKCSLEDLDRDKGSSYLSFTEFVKNEIEHSRKTKKKGTIVTYLTTLHKIQALKDPIHFSDLSYSFLEQFESLLKEEGMRQNSIGKHHKNLRFFINQAIKKDFYIPKGNPYSKFKVKTGQPRPRTFLSPCEIESIEDLEFSPEEFYLERERDAFLFTCYTGLRNENNRNLNLEMFTKEDGKFFLKTWSNKVEKHIYIPISQLFPDKNGQSRPGKIIAKYEALLKNVHGTKHRTVPIFGNISNQVTNRRLKVIAERAGINKNITTHVGRHTFATFMVDKIPLPYLQAMMQHSKISTTMRYVHLNERLISEGLKKVNW